MREVITEVIKKHITDAAAEDDAERAIKKKIGDFLRVPAGTGTLRAVDAKPPPGQEMTRYMSPYQWILRTSG